MNLLQIYTPYLQITEPMDLLDLQNWHASTPVCYFTNVIPLSNYTSIISSIIYAAVGTQIKSVIVLQTFI